MNSSGNCKITRKFWEQLWAHYRLSMGKGLGSLANLKSSTVLHISGLIIMLFVYEALKHTSFWELARLSSNHLSKYCFLKKTKSMYKYILKDIWHCVEDNTTLPTSHRSKEFIPLFKRYLSIYFLKTHTHN